MDNLNKLVREDFGSDLEQLINDEIKKTTEHVTSGSHDKQFSLLVQFYSLIRDSMPSGYRSKSGLPIRNFAMGFCEDLPYEYDEGITENTCLFLERQFWEVVFSSFTGSYRSACISLRHMLQLSCWVDSSSC